MKTIYKKNFHVFDNEFIQVPHNEYTNLKILKDIGIKERIIGLIRDITNACNIKNLFYLNTTHGGFIPIECSKKINCNNTIICDKIHYDNIEKNISELKDNHINIYENSIFDKITLSDTNKTDNLLFYSENSNISNLNEYLKLKPILLIHIDKNNNEIESNLDIIYGSDYKYLLKNTDLLLYIPNIYQEAFLNDFKYYIEKDIINILNYDNLINLCVMVKNAGPQFEDMLNKNMHLIDRWTILDTGSTDETIDKINKILIGKKKGNLYQETFINFRDSRNRLLELAGETCKYTLMLDDTYIIEGDLRKFLNTVRGDQFSDSFTLTIDSNDVQYGSNRILHSDRKLRYLYKIHEVITPENNMNIIIPYNDSHIIDKRYDYMEIRTMNRKKFDLELLQEEIDDDPENPRSYYYMAQTYNLLEKYELAFHYYIERMNCKREGFLQEKIDAIFEAARIANFKINRPWEECEKLYLASYELDKTRPDSLYFLGIHYFLENEKKVAFDYFKKAFEIGYPIHCQYSLKPTLSYHYLPRYLTQLCYEFKDFKLGEDCASLFLSKNKSNSEYYDVIVSWYNIFKNINKLYSNSNNNFNNTSLRNNKNKPYLIFVADGGFNSWSGSSILNEGVGGSETYIIEMARYIQKQGYFKVIVFCRCDNPETFEDVEYLHIDNYFDFISYRNVDTCIISRYSEYYPAAIEGNVKNIYLIAHDLSFTGIIIPIHSKLKKIFCLSEWHVNYLGNIFPQLKNLLVPFYYGIDFNKFLSNNLTVKQKNKFIYSSFPNRGLFELLQMWPRIYERYNDASLHIYCDLNNDWVNKAAGDLIKKIKLLLEIYDTKYNIYIHGWVNKKELSEAWLTSEYWFYPCTFMETFCLTALEAAITKTLAITNNLAALENTVGERGVVIEGDTSTQEWQNRALSELFKIMNNPTQKEILLNKNYNWALNLSWEKQANKLLTQYILSGNNIITKKPNNIIYLSIFYKLEYINLFSLFLQSMYLFGKIDCNTHILIYTSSEFKKIINDIQWIKYFTVFYEINDEINSVIDSCKARYNLFSFPIISNYSNILYLDADILICNDINPVFDLCKEDYLYVVNEINEDDSEVPYWGKDLFDDIEFKKKYSKTGINSGVMLFKNSKKMYNLFNDIINDMNTRSEVLNIYYDQPYLNYHAVINNIINDNKLKNLSQNMNNIMLNNYSLSVNKSILHFYLSIDKINDKYAIMNDYLNYKKNNYINNKIDNTKLIIQKHLMPIVENTNEKLEGSIFNLHESNEITIKFNEKQQNICDILMTKPIKNILEIGFNAGFSALLMLLTTSDTFITCVDICEHKYTMPCYNWINEHFSDRIKLIKGDSKQILNHLIEQKEYYDMIHIDGGHDILNVFYDIQNSIKLSKQDTILIMDDYDFQYINLLWNLFVDYNKMTKYKEINNQSIYIFNNIINQ